MFNYSPLQAVLSSCQRSVSRDLDRWVQQFAAPRIIRGPDTVRQHGSVRHGMEHERGHHAQVNVDDGLRSVAKAP